MTSALSLFTYDAVPADVASRLRQTADAIRSSASRQVDEVIAIGRALLDAKQALDHGQFGPWLTAEFSWTESTALNYMHASTTFGLNPQRVADLPLRLVYRLSAPSLPEVVRQKLLVAIDGGITGEREVKALLSQEMFDAKRAQKDAAKAPETKAREKAREEARRRKWQKERAVEEAEDALRRERTRLLVCDIVYAAPDIVDRLISLLQQHHSGHVLEFLREAKKNNQFKEERQ